MKANVRILLFGFINLNIMDGSAVFLTGFAKMLSLNPNITVDLVLATPIQRDILLKELNDIPNVNIISPFDDEKLIDSNPKWYQNGRLTYEEAANIVSYYYLQQNYDWIIIRGIEVVLELYQVNQSLFDKLMTYVTGLTFEDQIIPETEWNELFKVFKRSTYLLCQTEEMKNFIINKFPNIQTNIITLNPMVPDTTSDFEELFEKKDRFNKLCYVGKFHHDWNSIPMIVGFREIRETNPDAMLLIAGDKFTVHPEYPHYNDELKYLLNNTENLFWYGALTREDSRSLIAESDIGFSWRAENMNKSLELSVKLLEYGTLGKAVVMNRTPMHESIFGQDYPLYVGNLKEFEEAVNSVIEDPTLYYNAAKKMFEASKKFTYSETLNKLVPYLFESKLDEFLLEHGYIKESEWSTGKNSVPIRNEKGHSFVLAKHEVFSPLDVIDYLKNVSKMGKIINHHQENQTFYTVIDKDEESYYKNLEYNLNTDIFNEAINFIAQQNFYNVHNKRNVQLLKNKSRLQFGLNSKNPFVSNNVSLTSVQKRLKELEKIERKYHSLANSKLGKLTLKYWQLRKK